MSFSDRSFSVWRARMVMSMSTVIELTKMSIAKLRSRLQRIEMVLPNIPIVWRCQVAGSSRSYGSLLSQREEKDGAVRRLGAPPSLPSRQKNYDPLYKRSSRKAKDK